MTSPARAINDSLHAIGLPHYASGLPAVHIDANLVVGARKVRTDTNGIGLRVTSAAIEVDAKARCR